MSNDDDKARESKPPGRRPDRDRNKETREWAKEKGEEVKKRDE
jgi:hypothetical protein